MLRRAGSTIATKKHPSMNKKKTSMLKGGGTDRGRTLSSRYKTDMLWSIDVLGNPCATYLLRAGDV